MQTDKTDIAATAMLNLSNQHKQGNIKLSKTFYDALSFKLNDNETTVTTRLTMIGIIGRLKQTSSIDIIRKLIKETKSATIRRTSIGTLGIIGEEDDIYLLKKYEFSKTKYVALAAKAALKKIRARVYK